MMIDILYRLHSFIHYTPQTHRDYQELVAAHAAIKELNADVNRRKRDLDHRMQLCDVLNDIEDCPDVC